MARMRSVETGRYLARAANTGVSAIVDPYGRVVQSTDIPAGLFGEGIVNWGDQIVSISLQEPAGDSSLSA